MTQGIEIKQYQLEARDVDTGRWYRDEAEYDTEAELRDELIEIIAQAGKWWRIVEVIKREAVVSKGY